MPAFFADFSQQPHRCRKNFAKKLAATSEANGMTFIAANRLRKKGLVGANLPHPPRNLTETGIFRLLIEGRSVLN
jgi:hypothetical protein